MRLTLTINMDNAAFDDGNDGCFEASHILRTAAKHIAAGDKSRELMDCNGNKVGRYDIEEDE